MDGVSHIPDTLRPVSDQPPLLAWIQRLSAIAQSGLAFTPGVYDRQRYEQVRHIAAEMAAWPRGDVEAVDALFASDTGYITPKMVGRAAVFDSRSRILMVRETADGRWTLPGGWIDIGESPSKAVEREVFEETGYTVRATKLAALYDKLSHPHPPAPHHSYLLFILCELESGEAIPSVETSEVGWFARDTLPELSTLRATESQILAMFAHHDDPERPTSFD